MERPPTGKLYIKKGFSNLDSYPSLKPVQQINGNEA